MEEKANMEMQDITMSGVFVNTYTHSLDPKKRLTIPAEWRELVGEPKRLFVLPGVRVKCLCAYPASEMTHRLDKLRTLSIADGKGRQLARALASRSDWSPWDTQGRIRIKDDLLEYANLTEKVVLVGTFDGFELWNPERWDSVARGINQDMIADAAQYVGF